jgi:hypothetical protein
VLSKQYEGDRVLVHVRIPQRHLGPLHEAGTRFSPHQALSLPGGDAAADAAVSEAREEVA